MPHLIISLEGPGHSKSKSKLFLVMYFHPETLGPLITVMCYYINMTNTELTLNSGHPPRAQHEMVNVKQ